MKFLATVLPSSLEVRGELPSHLQFPQGHLLFWVAAHVNWMQHDFFLQEIFQQVEKSDWYQDKSRYRCRYKCRWLQIVEHCRSAVVFLPELCMLHDPTPLRPRDVLSWSTFSWRTQWWSSLPSEAYCENYETESERDMQKPWVLSISLTCSNALKTRKTGNYFP